MSRFVIETTFHLSVYRQRIYEAATIKDACRLAIDDKGWEDEEQDVDVSGDTSVTRIWENADCAYQGTARIIPDAFRETVQHKADLFDRLLFLLREPALSLVMSEADFRRSLPRVRTALADAVPLETAIHPVDQGGEFHERA